MTTYTEVERKEARDRYNNPDGNPKHTAHTSDADCTVDEETADCIECGVHHGGGGCPACGGNGFHMDDCKAITVKTVRDVCMEIDPNEAREALFEIAKILLTTENGMWDERPEDDYETKAEWAVVEALPPAIVAAVQADAG